MSQSVFQSVSHSVSQSMSQSTRDVTYTICSDCIEKLYYNIYTEHTDSIAILKVINKAGRPLNQSEIIKQTGLTTSMARDSLNILRGAKLLDAEIKGRSVCYSLSKDFRQSLVYLRGDLSKECRE